MIKDKQIAQLCGMSQRNLSCTYKRHKDPEKRKMYELLRLGAETYFSENGRQRNILCSKIDRIIKEHEKQIGELTKLRDELEAIL